VLLAIAAALTLARPAVAQDRDLVLLGGWLFSSTTTTRVHNPGILVRAGKFLRVGGDLSIAAPGADTIRVADSETIIPGLFDLHAHYAVFSARAASTRQKRIPLSFSPTASRAHSRPVR